MLLRAVVVSLAVVACAGKTSGPFEITKTQDLKFPKARGPECSQCIQIGDQAINQLINIILNAGVIGGCGQLCSHLPSPNEQKACDLVCSLVGLKAFTKALNSTDLDVFYFCEELHLCAPGSDDAHVDLVSASVDPATISKKDIQPGQGVDVTGTLTVNVTKASGVGEWSVSLHGPVNVEGGIGKSFVLADGLKEGVQQLGVKINIHDSLPDPTKQPPAMPVTFEPGSYEFRFHVCQGECGSKHPHSKDFGRTSGNFTITDSGTITI